MSTANLAGGFPAVPTDAARAFRAALTAMAHPGRITAIDGARPPSPLSVAAGTLLLVLADSETPVHLAGPHDTPAVREWLAFHASVRFVTPAEAVWAVGEWASLTPIDRFPAGTPQYPERSTTLIIERDELVPKGERLTGPGIADAHRLALPDPDALRANAARFPLGVDCFFTTGNRLAALPRSTRIGESQCT